MMYEFCAEDSVEEWLFFQENDTGTLVPRNEYRDLQCARCEKLDEFKSLKRGLQGVSFDTEYDVVLTGEDWLCVSSRFVDVYKRVGAVGLEFIPIPNGFSAVVCTNKVAIDIEIAGFEELRKCSVCGRFQERIVGPLAVSFGQMQKDNSFFVADVENENVRAVHQRIFVQSHLSRAFQDANLTGMCLVEW